jgi:radical SAM protein with 4Fe4S-binding SPASM domain
MTDDDRVPAPLQLFLELTSACNLSCPHCYLRAGEGRGRRLPPAEVGLLLDEFAGLGGAMVSVSGGEPLLYSRWRKVVQYARMLGLETMLLTNGTRLRADDARYLADVGCALAVSVDGARPETHDTLRGAGSHALVLAALAKAVDAGLGASTTLMFTPMEFNAAELPGVVALAARHGIGTVYVSLLEDRGRAHETLGRLALDEASLTRLLFTVVSLQERYPEVALECLNLKLFPERLRGVAAQTETLDRTARVTPDGEVFLTAYLDDDPFHLGTYRPGTLASLWHGAKVRQALTAAGRREAFGGRPCRSCPAWEWCRGGSAAFAWGHSGSLDGEDGLCGAKRTLVREFAGGMVR